jgi:plasmid replication initiation protein
MAFDLMPDRSIANERDRLLPDRHPQQDFFVADILDSSPKDDIASMEHPLFALKAGDKRIRRYERNGQRVEVLNRDRQDCGRIVHFTAYSFLMATNRGTSGDSYIRLADALERLRGTSIVTNITTCGHRERNGFGLIDSFRIVERSPTDNRMIAVSVTLPDWLYRSVQAKQVLTLSRDYFRLRKPLDRRIYELARKHCGSQPKWRVSIQVLHAKSGSTSPLAKFRMNIKALVASNVLPDYRMTWDETADSMTFYARGAKGSMAQISDILASTKPKVA